MEFILTTDTSCDCFKSKLKKDDIPYIPLTFTVDGTTFPDEFDSDKEYALFYQKIRDGAMPTTSQINPELHHQFFTGLLEGGAKAIVHLCLSGGLSSTYQSARLAAETAKASFPTAEIYIVDTLSATQAHGYLLEKAKAMRDNHVSAKAAAEKLDEIKGNLQVWILADNLMHLKRGGRVGAAAAIIGTMLNIKPILIINSNGGLSVVHKTKGTKKALHYFYEKVNELCPDYKTASFWVASADCEDKADQLIKLLRSKGCKGEISTGWIGPVIGAHTGPGTLGLVFEGKPRTQ